MSDDKDGGIWALGGYLYQVIGVLGIGAEFLVGEEDVDNDEKEFGAVLRDIKQSSALQVEIEKYGEDGLIRNVGLSASDQSVLIQFKFSRKIPIPKIGHDELAKILANFNKNVERAKKDGTHINACVLVSNKCFTHGEGSSQELWDKEEQRTDREYSIRKILGIGPEKFIDQLRLFATRYGVDEDEIQKGIERLIGHLLMRAVEKRIEPEDFKSLLVKSITDVPTANPLTIEYLFEKCQINLREFGKFLKLDQWDYQPLVRDVLDEVSKLISEHSLIGLCGPGGSGKSVLLWHILNAQNVKDIKYARDMDRNWIQKLINIDWRNITKLEESEDKALSRLVIANPDQKKPILWLGLDGLDEGVSIDQEKYIRTVIKWFWNLEQKKGSGPSDCVLIVSFRRPDNLRNLLNIPPDYQDRLPEVIKVGLFDHNNVLQALERHFPDINTSSLKSQQILGGPINPYSITSDNLPRVFEQQIPIHSSLYHPVVWRALLNIKEESLRKGAILGEKASLHALAKNILDWFVYKLEIRNRDFRINNQQVKRILSKLSSQTVMEKFYSRKSWFDIVIQDTGEMNANILYEEAESSGIIMENEDGKWYWKHDFVYEFLRNGGM